MKNTTIFLTLLSLLTVACGNTDDPDEGGGGDNTHADGGSNTGVDGGGNGGVDGGGNTSVDGGSDAGVDGGSGPGGALQCISMGWCTTWTADSNPVTDAPAFNGGTLRDGIYRLEQGRGTDEAMIIQGSSVLFVGDFWDNTLGTWKISNGRIAIQIGSYCDLFSSGNMSLTYDLAFAVRGDELFTQSVKLLDTPILRWRRVSYLCQESTSFKCRDSKCTCMTTTNKPLTGQPACH
ncbi:hypothetical protein [Corallococcus sp. Z5C101001]|uniref:hypothetical protein n=1 Tax=Corallococcus sp. Z5C101001 TaxID=2596829 RepID=UPI00117EAAC9|nr:hypothetical protein [Corallococcus sp. Z5C101001]TSC32338.1 hypothetical protein FOF48_09850 [Corallococcus sp. Z5C101001]